MKYNFDKIINRRGTNSYKWDIISEDNVIPMWVADMDFATAPAIIEALQERVSHGIFGYTLVPDSYYQSITNWFRTRHNWNIQKDWIIYTSGVIPAISCSIKALTTPGEKVLVQTPVYNCFYSSIKNQGCEVLENKLIREGNTYIIDFDDFEKKCSDEKTTVFLLCNPHNPAGRVWSKDELEKLNTICLRHGVKVISDEIHGELIMPGYTFIPFASVSEACAENSVILNSPTKAFNIAGLQIANIICKDSERRRKIDRYINIYEVCDVNPFGVLALEAAYNNSADWLDQLILYIADNYKYLVDFFKQKLPNIEVLKLEGTYLAWIDITATNLSSEEAYNKLLQGKVMLNNGTLYGETSGEGYLRLNLACPRQTLKEGLERIVSALK
jgi:cystathionine beta-lyase